MLLKKRVLRGVYRLPKPRLVWLLPLASLIFFILEYPVIQSASSNAQRGKSGEANNPAALVAAAVQRMSMKDPVVLAAGDIADCSTLSDEKTGQLMDDIDGIVLALGDGAYPDGSAADFKNCYGAAWGKLKARTFPAAGNHEYYTADASAYFNYFGAAAGEAGKGYYSYELGAWHVVVLNGNCSKVGGCDKGSAQERWLRADLAAHPATCTLAYWHQPLFSSGGYNGNDPEVQPLWYALYAAGADVVLNGHDHDYERFAPQDPTGRLDLEHGMREFVVGTGGKELRPFANPLANSEVRNADTFGVLKLSLHPAGYDWQFIPVKGATFQDSGSGVCSTGTMPIDRPLATATPFPTGPYSEEVEADRPVSYWRLGETSGTAVTDSIQGKTGQLRGGVTPGVSGVIKNDRNPAMAFNGKDGYISVADETSLNPTGDFSLEAWVRPEAVNGVGQAVVHKGGASGYDVWQYRLSLTSSNHWRGTIFIGGTAYSVTDPGTPSPSRWDYLVLNRNENVLTLYVNGVSVDTETIAGPLNTSGGMLAIGRTGSADQDYFNGSIDEVALYDHPLSVNRILAHYYAANQNQ